jgi:hypothetical protein
MSTIKCTGCFDGKYIAITDITPMRHRGKGRWRGPSWLERCTYCMTDAERFGDPED